MVDAKMDEVALNDEHILRAFMALLEVKQMTYSVEDMKKTLHEKEALKMSENLTKDLYIQIFEAVENEKISINDVTDILIRLMGSMVVSYLHTRVPPGEYNEFMLEMSAHFSHRLEKRHEKEEVMQREFIEKLLMPSLEKALKETADGLGIDVDGESEDEQKARIAKLLDEHEKKSKKKKEGTENYIR